MIEDLAFRVAEEHLERALERARVAGRRRQRVAETEREARARLAREARRHDRRVRDRCEVRQRVRGAHATPEEVDLRRLPARPRCEIDEAQHEAAVA